MKNAHPLITIRRAVGLTQKQLADLLGVDQSAISQYESGTFSMSVKVAKRLLTIAHELGHSYTLGQLYGTEPMPETASAAN